MSVRTTKPKKRPAAPPIERNPLPGNRRIKNRPVARPPPLIKRAGFHEYAVVPLEGLVPYEKNPRAHSAAQVEQLRAAIREFGFTNPLLIDEKHRLIAGHGRLEAARLEGLQSLPAIVVRDLTEAQRRALIIADNQLALNATWNMELLAAELADLTELGGLDLALLGFSDKQLEELTRPDTAQAAAAATLSERFILPPFSVLSAREGWWQDRKRAWLTLGIQSEVGRGTNTLNFSKTVNGFIANNKAATFNQQSLNATKGDSAASTGTSIFDPVLCEIAYRWFSPPDATVLDPFAGGSVRGIVAARLGRKYFGCDLRAEQIAANREQAREILSKSDPAPRWVAGDSRQIEKHCAGVQADLVFSCPPYADLEVYSDNPADLSTLAYPDFRRAYFAIIDATCRLLKDDRFACFVVAAVRDKAGNYHDLVGDTVEAFAAAGLKFYNDAILITAISSLAIRAGAQFSGSRKLGKTHQNVLVFLKGNAKRATKFCGPVEAASLAALEQTEAA